MKKRASVIHNFLIFVILLTTLLGLAPAASAQTDKPKMQMDAFPGAGGYFKYGEWMPVWVELENNGPDVDGEVRVRVPGSSGTMVYASPVSLPTVSRKRIPVYVLPNNFSRELEVQFVSGVNLVATQKIQVKPQANITYLIGLVAQERGALSLLSGITLPGQNRPVLLVDLGIQDLPERLEGLTSFDLLVFNDVDTSGLTPEQANALSNWVHLGGRLILGGGAGARTTLNGLPESLLPIALEGDTLLDAPALSGLAEYAGGTELQGTGSFVAATGAPRESYALVQGGEGPLVLERKTGQGWVDFIALDLSAAPFEGWSGSTNFWNTLLAPGGSYPTNMPPDMSPRQMRMGQVPYALSNLPVLDLPSARSLSVLLGVYILLIGPVNFLVLRWRRKLHWAWLTIPLLTALFSAGAFGLGYLMRGSDLILNKIALIELQPDGAANVVSYMGLFSPGQSSYEIQVDGDGLLSPTNSYSDPWGSPMPGSGGAEMVFVQGQPGQVRGLTVDQWSMQSFVAEAQWPEFGQVSAELTLGGDGLVGTLANQTEHHLRDVALILGKQFVRLGDVSPGAEVRVNMSFKDVDSQRFGPPISYMLFEEEFNSAGPTGPSRQLEVKRMILDSVFSGGSWLSSFKSSSPGISSLGQGVILLGWLDAAPPDVSITGTEPAQQTTALLVATLDYHLPEQGTISLAPGLIPGSLVEVPRDGGICADQGSTAVYIGNGEAVFEYQIPDRDKLQIETLNLSLWSDAGWWGAKGVELYHWQNEDWFLIKDPIQGINEISNAGRLVSDDGRVRVRLTSENGIQGCTFVNLGLVGALQ